VAGQTEKPVLRGTKAYVVVPTTLEMNSPKGRAKAIGFLFGISSDGGKNWKFVDGASMKLQAVRDILEVPADMKLPEPKDPEPIR
jgi:hypothetical protein